MTNKDTKSPEEYTKRSRLQYIKTNKGWRQICSALSNYPYYCSDSQKSFQLISIYCCLVLVL